MINNNDLPYEVIEMAKLAADKLLGLPMKSKEQYCKEYDLFVRWMEEKHVKSINECVILAYFEDLAKTYSPNSLWAKYSMLKKSILVNKSVAIGKYSKVIR